MIFNRMRSLRIRKSTGITIIEMLMYCMLAVIVGAVVYNTLRTGSSLSAKNAALNRSHDDLRGALDRLANNLRMARNVPTLLDSSGSVVSTGPAAGLRYDRIIGEPYAVEPVLTAGNLTAAQNTLDVYRSTIAVGTPPIPQINDLFLLDTPTGQIRVRITSVTTQPPSAGTQRISLTFASGLGQVLKWGANQPQWGRIVRQEAFIVMAGAGGKNELRFYPSFEPMPTLSDTSKYTVITNQVGPGTGEATPFDVQTVNGDKIIQANVRIQNRDYNRWLSNKQNNELNTYFRMNLSMTSRLRPKSTQ
jgi:hypothetical protein